MTKAGRFINRSHAAACLLLAVALLPACGSSNSSNGNSPSASGTPAPSSSAAPAPSPAKKTESFTADSLIEALKSNQSEVDDRLSYEEISLSGPIKIVDNHNAEFPSKDGGKVNCVLSVDTDKAVVQKLYEQSAKGSLPTATAVGTYKMSMTPDDRSDKHWYVSLIQCRIESAG
ncbi:MAG TPA: hypothetical protein VJ715_13755 [Pyrinomonadaceae bacterium]|nr:hypothetical protein [Pyrinomonadaceae bacterium]